MRRILRNIYRSTPIYRNPPSSYFSEFAYSFRKRESSMKSPIIVKSRLAGFYKLIHPDLFTQAPKEIHAANTNSLQLLNEYLNALEQNIGLQKQLLNFYVKVEKDESNLLLGEEKVKYDPVKIELIGLKPNVSDELRIMHMDNLVEALAQTVNEVGEKIKMRGSENENEEEDFSYDFGMGAKWQYNYKPMGRKDTEYKKLEQKYYEGKLNQIFEERPIQVTRDKMMDNVYRALYDIPEGISPRKPDSLLKFAVQTTEYFDDIDPMWRGILHPNLVYLDKKLTEKQIKKFRRRLDGRNLHSSEEIGKHQLKIKELGKELCSSEPVIYLHISNVYSNSIIPGFLTIPFNFKLEDLLPYFKTQKENILENSRKVYIYIYVYIIYSILWNIMRNSNLE